MLHWFHLFAPCWASFNTVLASFLFTILPACALPIKLPLSQTKSFSLLIFWFSHPSHCSGERVSGCVVLSCPLELNQVVLFGGQCGVQRVWDKDRFRWCVWDQIYSYCNYSFCRACHGACLLWCMLDCSAFSLLLSPFAVCCTPSHLQFWRELCFTPVPPHSLHKVSKKENRSVQHVCSYKYTAEDIKSGKSELAELLWSWHWLWHLGFVSCRYLFCCWSRKTHSLNK